MADMSAARRFVGLCDDSQDALLTQCIEAAKGWYERAGVEDQTGYGLYDLWVMNLAAWFFDNRGATGADAAIPPGIVSSVHQLRAKKAVIDP